MGKIIGIDLGTTNSCVYVMEGKDPKCITNPNGGRTTPSVVAFTDKERLVGDAAKRQAVTNSSRTVFAVKRLMGRMANSPEVEHWKQHAPYKIVAGANGAAVVEIDGHQYTPQEVSATILSKLKADAEAYLGEPVTEAVITVPAYFNDAQRQATKDAGQIAGLDVKRIINEPTAASLAYGFDKKANEKIVVFDLGGGTFDVSILEVGDNVVEVRATNGDTFLGGEDFDQRVINYLVEEFKKEQGIDLAKDSMALQRLKDAAEAAKKELSTSMESEINLPFITADQTGPKHMLIKLSRAKLEQLVSDLVQKTLEPCRKALADAGMTIADVDAVAVTFAPGLIGAVLVGVNFAKGLAYSAGKPLVPVHHLRGHIAALYLTHPELKPPFLCLVASGGHSHIVEVLDYTHYHILGHTVDDAAGEAFDKVARTLGLPYPGGPSVANAAKTGDPKAYRLPVPHVDGKYNVSFSGLKTAVLNEVNKAQMKNEEINVPDLAASFQERIAGILAEKLLLAAADTGAKQVCLAGGVAANGRLRQLVNDGAQKLGAKVYLPELKFCGDNGAMIAAQGYYQYIAGHTAGLELNGLPTLPIDYE